MIRSGRGQPKSEEYPYNQDVTQPEVEQFLEDGGYTFPVVMDVTGEVFYSYGISAFPTTFMIGADGNVFGYGAGSSHRRYDGVHCPADHRRR